MTFFTKICIVFLCNFLIINSGLYTLSLNSYQYFVHKRVFILVLQHKGNKLLNLKMY